MKFQAERVRSKLTCQPQEFIGYLANSLSELRSLVEDDRTMVTVYANADKFTDEGGMLYNYAYYVTLPPYLDAADEL